MGTIDPKNPITLPASAFAAGGSAPSAASAEAIGLKVQQGSVNAGTAVDKMNSVDTVGSTRVNNPFSAASRSKDRPKAEDAMATNKPPSPHKKCGGVLGKIFGGIDKVFKKITHAVLAPFRFIGKMLHKVTDFLLKNNLFSLAMRKMGLEKFDPAHYLQKGVDLAYKGTNKVTDLGEKALNKASIPAIEKKVADKLEK